MNNSAINESIKTPVLIDALFGKLEDCKTVINCLVDEQYQITTPYQAAPHKTHSSIGQHMRHVIEFVQTLLKAQGTGLVNYDARQRDGRIETDREYAKAAINELKKNLETITSQDLEVPIKSIEAVHVQYDIEPLDTSFGREILFVIAHTEHHFALIGGQCDALGVVLPDNFGKAISTLRHELSLQK